ncbi:hypothetical protein R1flu_023093 [Riccia fluitans]|uniref:Uncharacterized protein n=1 Tax=Riccia fluitans TaxID=41844 RepID=A0ABD1XU08_9MARC
MSILVVNIEIREETDSSQLFFKWIMIGSTVRYERAHHDINGELQPKALEDLTPEDGLKYNESEAYGGLIKLFTWKRKRLHWAKRITLWPNVVDYITVYFGLDGIPKKFEFVDENEAREIYRGANHGDVVLELAT